jgi:uncharacterized protein YjbI with pentapeptide repeats
LTAAIMTGANANNADFTGAVLTQAIMPDGTMYQ